MSVLSRRPVNVVVNRYLALLLLKFWESAKNVLEREMDQAVSAKNQIRHRQRVSRDIQAKEVPMGRAELFLVFRN